MAESIPALSTRRRWVMLAVSMAAQGASALYANGAAFLIPELHDQRHLSLASAGVLVAMPTLGFVLTLIAWGALVDRVGERRVLVVGLLLTAAAAAGAALSGPYVLIGAFLLLGGMAAASTNAASGRVVVGWFPQHQRGFAMGIRQMAQPLGVGLAALTIPPLAAAHGLAGALALPAAFAAAMALACAVLVKDPPRVSRAEAAPEALANPYRGSSLLWRIHGVSVLLVVPQFVVWTYGLVWLISDRGWSAGAAGLLITVAQLLGAAGRMAAGAWSDRVGSRMKPLRAVAVAAATVMLALAFADWLDSSVAVVLLVVATVISVADNGLAFTSVAEIGGPFWGGRAMGAQNTAQFLAASAVPPVLGALIAAVGYPLAFALTAVLPAIAVPIVPVDLEKSGVGVRVGV
ncbi:MAG TPA: MFS transporter [Frankiaceae bacterium]|jgi:sugar phosphate permease|nr:MFS transporter [Frankiaceae bacterium]